MLLLEMIDTHTVGSVCPRGASWVEVEMASIAKDQHSRRVDEEIPIDLSGLS
jgi:hypothetical protein